MVLRLGVGQRSEAWWDLALEDRLQKMSEKCTIRHLEPWLEDLWARLRQMAEESHYLTIGL